MTNVIQFNRKTTFERLCLDEDSTVINFGEGFCFRYKIPKHEKQLVTYFGGLSYIGHLATLWFFRLPNLAIFGVANLP